MFYLFKFDAVFILVTRDVEEEFRFGGALSVGVARCKI